ncbi:hypothetical protein GCM10008119_25260 [Pedobacter mendelii]|uniref:Uncharacterized protein n=1 Tax=Pedobacter mendelii TaxID=1908240 RepID=A0ABQ2BIJ5_9SPHI|nr:hypothetical protein GCM10008119_25260 [Pedobacter mendelii]
MIQIYNLDSGEGFQNHFEFINSDYNNIVFIAATVNIKTKAYDRKNFCAEYFKDLKKRYSDKQDESTKSQI